MESTILKIWNDIWNDTAVSPTLKADMAQNIFHAERCNAEAKKCNAEAALIREQYLSNNRQLNDRSNVSVGSTGDDDFFDPDSTVSSSISAPPIVRQPMNPPSASPANIRPAAKTATPILKVATPQNRAPEPHRVVAPPRGSSAPYGNPPTPKAAEKGAAPSLIKVSENRVVSDSAKKSSDSAKKSSDSARRSSDSAKKRKIITLDDSDEDDDAPRVVKATCRERVQGTGKRKKKVEPELETSPLCRACRASDVHDVKILLKQASDRATLVNEYGSKGMTPLMYACEAKLKCSAETDAEIVRILCEHGADVEAVSLQMNQTALIIAVAGHDPTKKNHHRLDVVCALIEWGAEEKINLADTEERTALITACSQKSGAVCKNLLKILLDAAANPNLSVATPEKVWIKKTSKGLLPLTHLIYAYEIAQSKAIIDAMDVLLNPTYDCEIDKRDQYGFTSLHYAISTGLQEAVKYLWNRGASLKLKGPQEESAVSMVNMGDTDMIKLLHDLEKKEKRRGRKGKRREEKDEEDHEQEQEEQEEEEEHDSLTSPPRSIHHKLLSARR